jgi:hypothetical protein
MEPKLETKSNRRQSRRAFNMETAEMEASSDALLDDAFGDGGVFTPSETGEDGAGDLAADDEEDADWSKYAETKSGDVSESSQ